MNGHSIEHRLDQAIDALNTEASPAPYEQGDRELFSLVDTARLAKSLRDPAEPDANFPQLAIDRITADLRQSAPGNGIPPAATPTIGGHSMTTPDNTSPRGPIPFFRRHAQLAAILAVLLLVGGGLLIYQSLGPDDDGSPAVGVPDDDDAVVADATPTASDPDEDVEPVPAVTELRIDGMLCCGAVSGVVDGETYMFTLSQAGAMHVMHVDELGSLELVGSLETPVSIMPGTLPVSARVAFDDGIFYAPLPNDETPGLWIVDVTDPTNPVEVALVETELPPLSVAASNGVAAVAPMSFTGPLYVFDVSDPANAELVGEHDFSVASMPPAMEFAESLLYLTGHSGVVVIDLTDPASPQEAGSFPNPEWDGPQTSGQMGTNAMNNPWFRHATLLDDHLIVAAGNAGILIIDVSDPSNLQEVSQLDFDIPAFRVAATDTELYVLDTSIGSPGAAPISEPIRIHTVDVSDIANPTISQSTLGPDGGMAQWLLTVNDNLYLLDYGIIRMFDPTDAATTPDDQGAVTTTPAADAPVVSTDEAVIERFREVQAEVDFDLAVPVDLIGFGLQEGRINTSGTTLEPGVMAMLVDNDSQPSRMLSLYQRPAGFGPEMDRSDYEAENIVIQGVETVLYCRTILWQGEEDADSCDALWEMNGMNYSLATTAVDRDTFLEIAESITPLSELDGAVFATPEPDAGSPATDDPVEFVLAYQQALEDRDMDAVRGMLVERFREFDDDVIWQGPHVDVTSGVKPSLEDWTVENNEHFTVVRYTNLPVFTYVLRREDNNEWLVDRGSSAYWWLVGHAYGAVGDFGGLVDGVRIERISDNLDSLDAQTVIGINLLHVELQDDASIDVTIEWMLTRSLTADVALDGVHWVAGDDSGAVEITWATARLADNSMEFPALPDGMDGSPTYMTTFTLYDIPQEGSFELHIPDMTVIDRDGNENHLTTIIHAPIAEYPQRSD